jgi:alpha-beta hydrolase superfamily lysophospholipase
VLNEINETIKSYDGTELFLRIFSPYKENFAASNLNGVIIAVHGFCEHSGRYEHVARTAIEANFGFVTFDIRGHGKSGPRRGDAQNLSSLVLDILFIFQTMKSRFAHKDSSFSYGLLGHSFGGLLVTYAASQLQDSSVPIFLSSPCYAVKQHIPFLKKYMVLQMANFIPKFTLPVGIQYENISTNEENNRAYEQDPLRLNQASVRYAEIFFHALDPDNIKHAMQSISSPVTLISGKEDGLVDSCVTDKLVPYFKSVAKYAQISGSGHEIFNEVEAYQKQAFSYLNHWIGSLHDTNRKSL